MHQDIFFIYIYCKSGVEKVKTNNILNAGMKEYTYVKILGGNVKTILKFIFSRFFLKKLKQCTYNVYL
jgi:hypothetical protein